MTLAEIGSLVDFLRSKGVVQFSGLGLSLSLLPESPPASEPPARPEPTKPKKVGADGLTREQQIEHYGSPMADTEEG